MLSYSPPLKCTPTLTFCYYWTNNAVISSNFFCQSWSCGCYVFFFAMTNKLLFLFGLWHYIQASCTHSMNTGNIYFLHTRHGGSQLCKKRSRIQKDLWKNSMSAIYVSIDKFWAGEDVITLVIFLLSGGVDYEEILQQLVSVEFTFEGEGQRKAR